MRHCPLSRFLKLRYSWNSINVRSKMCWIAEIPSHPPIIKTFPWLSFCFSSDTSKHLRLVRSSFLKFTIHFLFPTDLIFMRVNSPQYLNKSQINVIASCTAVDDTTPIYMEKFIRFRRTLQRPESRVSCHHKEIRFCKRKRAIMRLPLTSSLLNRDVISKFNHQITGRHQWHKG